MKALLCRLLPRLKLIPNWRDAWRFLSIQFIAIGATLQLALLAYPNDIRQYLPDPVTHGIAVFCLAAAAFGRVTHQSGVSANDPN